MENNLDNLYEDTLSCILSTLTKKGNKMKYKIGDVVQCIDEMRETYGFKVGNLYTIMAIEDEHTMLDNLKWWDTYGYPNDFKLVEETTMKNNLLM